MGKDKDRDRDGDIKVCCLYVCLFVWGGLVGRTGGKEG